MVYSYLLTIELLLLVSALSFDLLSQNDDGRVTTVSNYEVVLLNKNKGASTATQLHKVLLTKFIFPLFSILIVIGPISLPHVFIDLNENSMNFSSDLAVSLLSQLINLFGKFKFIL